MTDIGAKGLCAALSFDRRLVLLSLRACLLGPETEGLFVELMRDHLALARVDLRQSLDPAMGILKVWRISVQGESPLSAYASSGLPTYVHTYCIRRLLSPCSCASRAPPRSSALPWASHICPHLLHTMTSPPAVAQAAPRPRLQHCPGLHA